MSDRIQAGQTVVYKKLVRHLPVSDLAVYEETKARVIATTTTGVYLVDEDIIQTRRYRTADIFLMQLQDVKHATQKTTK